MNTKQVDIIISQAEIILDEAKSRKGKGRMIKVESRVEYLYFLRNIDLLITQFNILATKVNVFIKNEGIDDEISNIAKMDSKEKNVSEGVLYNSDEKILELIFGSQKILTIVRQGVILPETTLNKLDSLNKELNDIKESLSAAVFENLILAIESFERGSFLGSSLISGRVLRSSFDQVAGKDINEKVSELKKYDLVRAKDGEDSIIKASHFGRNLMSHDLKLIPSSSESLSFLGDSIKIVKIVAEYTLKKNEESKPDSL